MGMGEEEVGGFPDRFNRVSQTAEQVLVSAVKIAEAYGARDVGTDHLLYALASFNDGWGVGRFLRSQNISEGVVEALLIKGEHDTLPFLEERDLLKERDLSPAGKNAIKAAATIAQEWGHNYITPVHFLQAILEQDEGGADYVLSKLERSKDFLKSEFREYLRTTGFVG